MKIDLTNLTGTYRLIVNAEISSQSSNDYGYATVKSNTTAPSYSNSTGRFIYISGEQDAKDYTSVLQGGQKYYLHLGYRKNSSTSSGEDKFTINSINLTPNDADLYHTEVTTNNEGKAITQLPFGKYQVTEVNTPEGYIGVEPFEIEFRDSGIHEFTIENEKEQRVIVHHYIKGTTIPVAEDDTYTGKSGENYITAPHLDLEKYELEKDAQGSYVIPANSTGQYDNDVNVDQVVTYYYEEKEFPLTVHHYIEGTTTPVPLKGGSGAPDETNSGKEGESYTTDALTVDELSDKYEIAEIPANASGVYTAPEVEVTYFYKIAERPLTIIKTGQDGELLSGVTFEIQSTESANLVETIGKIGKLEQNGNYYFVEQDGKYISNNQQQSSTTANSYIKIDLTNKESVTLKVNAEISSESGYDYGYATITESTIAPSYNSSIGRFIYISGIQSARDYETTLEGGKVYYLHLGYRKDGIGNTSDDTFTINSININDYNILTTEKYITNEQGKISVDLKAGEYVITETETVEGYKLPENPSQTINITKIKTLMN